MSEYSRMKGQAAAVTGTLMHSHTAHHYTSVLLQAQKVERIAEPNKRVQATRETRAPDA
jgi:hypothetical protein